MGDAAASWGTDNSDPYEAALGTLAPGTYEIYATVNDGVGTATSTTNTFTVNALSITLDRPLDPSTYSTVESVPGTATVANVQEPCTVTFQTNFNNGGWSDAGTGSGGPPTYGLDLGTFGVGTLLVRAIADDAGTLTATSDTHSVTIELPVLAIDMIFPAGQTFAHDASITATSTVEYGEVNYTVTFHTNRNETGWGDVSGGSGEGPDFTADLGTLPDGDWQIYATVVDNVGSNATSATNSFTVLAAPTVTLDAPTPDQEFSVNGTITASATPADGNGSYTVFFWTNSSLSGTFGVVDAGGIGSSPYTNRLNSAVAGTNYVYATVTDGNGKTASSPQTNNHKRAVDKHKSPSRAIR